MGHRNPGGRPDHGVAALHHGRSLGDGCDSRRRQPIASARQVDLVKVGHAGVEDQLVDADLLEGGGLLPDRLRGAGHAAATCSAQSPRNP